MKNIITIKTKTLSVGELRDINVPPFQRWVNEANTSNLSKSVGAVGVQRCIVLCYVKQDRKTYIIDGNHLRHAIIDNPENEDEHLVDCIYNVRQTLQEAAEVFRLLNTTGRQLTLMDYTMLYLHIPGVSRVYRDVFELVGSPVNEKGIKEVPRFTIPTIVDILSSGNKAAYREGTFREGADYNQRLETLTYLMQHANKRWAKVFGQSATVTKPNGGGMIAMVNHWFNAGYHAGREPKDFLHVLTSVYKTNEQDIKAGNRIDKSNAVAKMKLWLADNNYKKKVGAQ